MSPKFINESSTGVINGLILCINSFTFGSLLVSHYSANLVGVAVGAMLISGIFGSLYGILSKDKSLTCGPSGTVASIMAGPTLIFFSGSNLTAETFIFPIVLLGLLVALIFYFTAKLGVANLFKFIPFS
jgi:MFS superfamily sulfate permease-like transporter